MSCTGSCLFFLPIAAVPSILWLCFFFAQKRHREKLRNIIRIFVWGILIAVPVIIAEQTMECFLENGLGCLGDSLYATPLIPASLIPFLFSFGAVAFVEEFAKYLVVRFRAMPYTFFNEPQDAILYMITAGLGFAAIENILYIGTTPLPIPDLIKLAALRGMTATLLHATASGTLGYFLALYLYDNPQKKRKLLYTGIILATLLHGVYNNFIINLDEHITILKDGTGGVFSTLMIGLLLLIASSIILISIHRLARLRFVSKNREAITNQ